ncbi:MAG: hypothetical protein ACREC2_12820 [Bradyrhizobium sp.]|jgi:hypothetical protein
MNVIPFAPDRFGVICGGPARDRSLDTAWMVLEAANDLGDAATVDVCRRVIDANLGGKAGLPSDLRRLAAYFR